MYLSNAINTCLSNTINNTINMYLRNTINKYLSNAINMYLSNTINMYLGNTTNTYYIYNCFPVMCEYMIRWCRFYDLYDNEIDIWYVLHAYTNNYLYTCIDVRAYILTYIYIYTDVHTHNIYTHYLRLKWQVLYISQKSSDIQSSLKNTATQSHYLPFVCVGYWRASHKTGLSNRYFPVFHGLHSGRWTLKIP